MGFNVGLSGSSENSKANDRQAGLGETPYSTYSPRIDLAYRLADIANQYGAQENLMFGGAGYGGSFESAAQRAARASGNPIGATPYGGTGGYGSSNPVMTRPTNTPIPANPLPPKSGTGTPTPVGGQGGQSGGYPTPRYPDGDPYRYPPGPSTGGQPGVPVNPRTPVGQIYTGEQPTSRASAVAQPKQSAMKQQLLATPGVAETMAKLRASGAPEQVLSSALLQINKGISSGLTPDQIAGHYMGKAQAYGGDWAKMSLAGHHANWKLTDDVVAGLKAGQDMSKTGWTDPRWGSGPEGVQPASAATTETRQPVGTRAMVGGRESAYSAFETPAYTATANNNAQAEPQDSSQSFWNTLQDGVQQITESDASKNWIAQQGWNNPEAAAAKTTATRATGTGVGQAAMSVDGGNGGLVWDPFNGEWKPGGGDLGGGGYAAGGGGSPNGNSDTGYKGNRDLGLSPRGAMDLEPNGPVGIQYPSWGQQWTWQEPELDENGKMIPIKRADGKIAYKMKTVSRDKWEFEQGQNDGQTADAWSTSAGWRPEEPTGGVYGGYSDLAAGKLTDYENEIGKNWRDMYSNPNLPSDDAYNKLLGEYQKSPGKGIDEAFGAYNRMLKGNGYSDAEKGAIEGSAVRGVTQGYQRNADEMRRQAARTGNANAAYAAMAAGGASYGSQLGEINRQNQLKFADEAQRRQEVGGQGMTNVASLANQKAQFGLNAGADYAKEMARRKEAAARGMGDYATFGRGLQQQGLAGLNDLLKQQNQSKQNTYQQIASLLNQGSGSASIGNAKDFGWNTGFSV